MTRIELVSTFNAGTANQVKIARNETMSQGYGASPIYRGDDGHYSFDVYEIGDQSVVENVRDITGASVSAVADVLRAALGK